MCPNGNIPSGTISNNKFINCPGIESIYANPAVKDCAANITLTGNEIDGGLISVAQPQITYNPPAPDSIASNPVLPVVAFCTTVNATIRYTLDGSRQVEISLSNR